MSRGRVLRRVTQATHLGRVRGWPERLPAPAPSTTAGRVPAGDGTGLRVGLVLGRADGGGVTAFVSRLARALVARGAAVALFAIDGDRSVLVGLPVEVDATVGMEPSALVTALDAWSPDVVSVHAAGHSVLEAVSNRPAVETVHRTLLDADSPEVRGARRLSRSVAVSDMARKRLLALSGAVPQQVVTVPNGAGGQGTADRAAARAALGLERELLVLCLGRYGLQKNPVGAVKAFAGLARRRRDAVLLMAGEVEDPLLVAGCRAVATTNGLGKRVRLRGHTVAAPALLAAADVLLLDSFFEGWPLAATEAVCAGTPVVMSDVGGGLELVGDGVFGRLTPNPLGDPLSVTWQSMAAARFRRQLNEVAVVDALEQVAAMPASVPERRSRAAAARTLFDEERCWDAHVVHLREAAAAHRRPTPRSAGART